MLNEKHLITPAEQPIELEGQVGKLEGIVHGANQPASAIAVLGHPHSLHGGTINNKVVTTLVRACREAGVPSIRFNFRGVGRSDGTFDRGIGESEDVLKVISLLKTTFPTHQIILAGFSFGAYVTYRAACRTEAALLLSVAPAVNHGDFTEFPVVPNPWTVMVAGADEIVPTDDILAWHSQCRPAPNLIMFNDASHFFHGRLVELKKAVVQTLTDILR